MKKKGYVFVVLFSLFTAISRSLYYRAYMTEDLASAPTALLLFQCATLFVIVLIPGLLITRWYYKLKDSKQG